MSTISDPPWPQDGIDLVIGDLTVRKEQVAPYLLNFLQAARDLGHGSRRLHAKEISNVEAAWEYRDDEDCEYGFVLGFVDGRRAYIEGRRQQATTYVALRVQSLSPEQTWRDVAASRAASAAGWVEQPEELNIFVQRMNRAT
jgi:hypothetical protein